MKEGDQEGSNFFEKINVNQFLSVEHSSSELKDDKDWKDLYGCKIGLSGTSNTFLFFSLLQDVTTR